MTILRLLTYAGPDGQPVPGLTAQVDERPVVIDARAVIADARSTVDLLADWDTASRQLALADLRQFPAIELADVRLLPPLRWPGAVYAAAANHAGHVREMSGRKLPPKHESEPYFFLTPPRPALTATLEDVILPATSRMVDWEAELAVVIGRTARNIDEGNALTHIAGYACAADLGARDLLKRPDTPYGTDWLRAKAFDGSLPLGPWITCAPSYDDLVSGLGGWHELNVRLWVNADLMQDFSTSEMFWTVPEQIAWLSRHVTLYPGDVILTGTGIGVGFARRQFLCGGDRLRITVTGPRGDCGQLKTRLLAPEPRRSPSR